MYSTLWVFVLWDFTTEILQIEQNSTKDRRGFHNLHSLMVGTMDRLSVLLGFDLTLAVPQ